MNSDSRTTVVLLTPEGRGAIASVRVEGPRAAGIVRLYFGNNAQMAMGRIYVGRWSNASVNSTADPTPPEEVVVCRLSDDELEVHCHGGLASPERIVADLLEAGCVELTWRDWIRGQEPDSISAAARQQLAIARPAHRRNSARSIQRRSCGEQLTESSRPLIRVTRQGTVEQTDALLQFAAVGLHLIEPWRIVLAGPPNAGKSSLINALVGYGRSIVHATPGTTRDAVSVATAYRRLADRAGRHSRIAPTDDPLERAGIERTRQQIAAADVVVLLFDMSEAWTSDATALASDFPNAIVVQNKIDLLATDVRSDRCWIAVSAKTGEGIDGLIDHILRRLIVARSPTVTRFRSRVSRSNRFEKLNPAWSNAVSTSRRRHSPASSGEPNSIHATAGGRVHSQLFYRSKKAILPV